ncbi:proteasome subunit beta type-6-like [Rhododendron vialii]|uniref:proteasome subunit beta type-6-like n=1 Tax=Rhododendron vialii TaxID=182163 RepID=UPI00265D9B2A|nr:proteasome subunit beta type-6-like [Rhododendron vialii]
MDPSMADLNAPHSMGTTIIGVTYNGGVVLGADSHTCTGMYVANRASDKITQLTDNVYLYRSGSAADSQVVGDYVRYHLHHHTSLVEGTARALRSQSVEFDENSRTQTVKVANWFQFSHGFRELPVKIAPSILEKCPQTKLTLMPQAIWGNTVNMGNFKVQVVKIFKEEVA